MLKKYVITGGPCSGKTTLIKELEKQGFTVFHEAAREILENKRFNKETQYEIFKKQLKQIRETEDLGGIVFLDRGIPDSLGYFKHNNFKIPSEILQRSKLKETKYEEVFFLEPVSYTRDEIRKESKEEAKKIHNIIYATYNELGYKIIKVPLMSVEKRVDFIKGFL